jgi:hypothetical protein
VDGKRLSYRRRLWVLAAAVACIGVVVYLRALANGFTNWEDPGYVVENSQLGPLDARFLAWAFTTFQQGNWHPLAWLSLGVDHALFGIHPLGYHLSSVVLHGATSLTVVLLVGALFERALGAGAGRGCHGWRLIMRQRLWRRSAGQLAKHADRRPCCQVPARRLEAIMHSRGFSAALSAIVVPTQGQRNRALRGEFRRARLDRWGAELRGRSHR